MNVSASMPSGDREAEPASDHVLSGRGLAKSFGATKALRGFDFELKAGEVHTIQGENGSGKSTLVKILAGVHSPDRGDIVVGGQTHRRMDDPGQSLRLGIGTVFQEVLVVGPRSIFENVWLGADSLFAVAGNRNQRRARTEQVLDELMGRVPDLSTPIESLSLSDRQACAIARALLRDPSVLVLDEATSALDVATRDRLFAILRRRAESGNAVLFISHRMDEVTEISDRVTVMRLGETVATVDRQEATPDRLIQLMTGAEVKSMLRARASTPGSPRPALVSIRGMKLDPDSRPIDLDIQAGEMIGLAGLEGHGQDAFLQALVGGPIAGGVIDIETGAGRQAVTSRHQAAKLGVAYVPRERKTESLFLPLSILDNFALPTLERDRRGGLVSFSRTKERFLALADTLGIRYNDVANPVSTLSGGNQQKVVMARWLAAEPKVLLLNDPTRGVDAHTKNDLYQLLTSLSDAGLAIVMISSEVDEHLALMDRVLVMRDREVFREFGRDGISRQALIAGFFGETSEPTDDAN